MYSFGYNHYSWDQPANNGSMIVWIIGLSSLRGTNDSTGNNTGVPCGSSSTISSQQGYIEGRRSRSQERPSTSAIYLTRLPVLMALYHQKKKKSKKRTSSGLSFHNQGVLQRRMATRTLPSGSSFSEKKAKNTVRVKRETRPRLWELGNNKNSVLGKSPLQKN